MVINKDRKDIGFLREYCETITGNLRCLKPTYCDDRFLKWKNVAWYLIWVVYRYVLGCETYEEALTYANMDVLSRFHLIHCFTQSGKMYLGIDPDDIGISQEEMEDNNLPTLNAELSGNGTDDAILQALEIALDILYHDVPPHKQIEVALSHAPKNAYGQRRVASYQKVLDAMRTFSKTFLRIVLFFIVFAGVLANLVSPAYADPVRFDPEGNWVYEGGVNSFDGTRCQNREETRELESRLISMGYVQFSSVPKEEYDALYPCLSSKWFDEREYPPDRCRLYIPGDTYHDAIEQVSEYGMTYWYTQVELSGACVMIDYAHWDRLDLEGTEDIYINELCDPDFSAYLEVTSPVSCEVRVLQVYTGQFVTLYLPANEPILVIVSEGTYCVQIINGIGIMTDDGFFALEHGRDTESSPYRYSLKKLVEKYKVPAGDIVGKPNKGLHRTEEFFGESYRVNVNENGEVEQTAPAAKQRYGLYIKLIIGSVLLLFVVIAGYFLYRNRRSQ